MPSPLFQFPNRPLIAAMLAAGVARATRGSASREAALISQLALAVWAYEEMADGDSWFRRLIGAAGLVYSVAGGARSVSQLRSPRVES